MELREELGIELAVRIGVNTGDVVGDHATGQAFVTGDTGSDDDHETLERQDFFRGPSPDH